MSATVRRGWTAVLLAGLVALGGAGCVRMPHDGPVVAVGGEGSLSASSQMDISPKPPAEGATASEIVTGFLDAMTASPITTSVARQYLTSDLQDRWRPESQTITYSETNQRRSGPGLSVRLMGARSLDGSGAYEGRLPREERTVQLPLVREDGELRIAEAPDALIVPESWFESRFRQVSVYYFDPTARILVPEPVFVPTGERFATALVQALISGPGPALDGVNRSFVPSGLELGLSVPVLDDGVANLNLTGTTGQLTEEATELFLAQLAWTLRQDPTITAMRVSIGGQPVTLPGGISLFPVNDQGSEYDPSLLEASSLLYGLRDGLLVAGPPQTLTLVEGPFGTAVQGVRSVAVNLGASRVVGVSGDGSALLRASVRGPDPGVEQVVSEAEDLLRPSWDFTDRVWLVDARRDGSQVLYLAGDRVRRLRVPGMTGERLTEVLVSRDGTRLVAVARRPSGDRLLVSRVRHDTEGRVIGATEARVVPFADEPGVRVRDIGWATPTSVAVLQGLGPEYSLVRTLSVDGAPAGLDSVLTKVPGRVSSLAASPAEEQNLYAVTPRGLVDLTQGGLIAATVDPRIAALDYVG